MNAGYEGVSGTRGSGIVSSAAGVLGTSVVRGTCACVWVSMVWVV